MTMEEYSPFYISSEAMEVMRLRCAESGHELVLRYNLPPNFDPAIYHQCKWCGVIQ